MSSWTDVHREVWEQVPYSLWPAGISTGWSVPSSPKSSTLGSHRQNLSHDLEALPGPSPPCLCPHPRLMLRSPLLLCSRRGHHLTPHCLADSCLLLKSQLRWYFFQGAFPGLPAWAQGALSCSSLHVAQSALSQLLPLGCHPLLTVGCGEVVSAPYQCPPGV